MNTKFENNDIVRIVGKNGTCPPTIKVYDKNGNEMQLFVDPDFEYIVDETSVMPIRQLNNGAITLYPLSAGRNAHTKKFYVPEEYLEYAYPEEDEEDLDMGIFGILLILN